MPISDICRENAVSIEAHETLMEAAKLMADRHVGNLVVIEKNGTIKPIGIVTDRDIVLAVGRGASGKKTRVKAVMSPTLITASPKAGVHEVAAMMRDNSVRRIPIVDEDSNVLSVVSVDDLYQLLAAEISMLSEISDRQIFKEEEEVSIALVRKEGREAMEEMAVNRGDREL